MLFCPFVLIGQNNRKPLAWTGFLTELTCHNVDASLEVENSRLLKPARQDYFTVLSHAEFRLKDIRVGLGLSGWLLYDPKELAVPEWRPHQQVKYSRDFGRLSLLQRTRIENRFIRDTLHNALQSGYHFTLRPRILFQTACTAFRKKKEKGHTQLALSHEVILEYDANFRGYAESRTYLGCWYAISPNSTLQVGYVWIYAVADQINNSDIIYVTWRNNLECR